MKAFRYKDNPIIIIDNICAYNKINISIFDDGHLIVFYMNGGHRFEWRFDNFIDRDLMFERIEEAMDIKYVEV